MKLLLLGGNGQVGWQLRRSLATLGEVVAPLRDGVPCGDLARPRLLQEAIRIARPDVVVNAAAYTAVDRAEDEPDEAFAINATACQALAEVTQEIGSWLVHYSSDYVYRGDGVRPWVESDPCAPLGVYGTSKLGGDVNVSRNPRHLIFRTSWVFDTWGDNFLRSILNAAALHKELTVVADQWGAPTRAALVADVTATALRQVMSQPHGSTSAGIFHLAAAGETNWNDYARFAIAEAASCGMRLRARPQDVRVIGTADYPARAPRPANSRLDTAKLRGAFGIHLPPWQDGVRAVVAEWAAAPKERT